MPELPEGVFLTFEKFINFNRLAMNTDLSSFFRFHNTSFDLTIFQKSAGMAGTEKMLKSLPENVVNHKSITLSKINFKSRPKIKSLKEIEI